MSDEKSLRIDTDYLAQFCPVCYRVLKTDDGENRVCPVGHRVEQEGDSR